MGEALIGLIGVVIGALMTAAKDIWVDRRSRQKNAEYLAIRVVSIFDRFIEGCVGVAGDDGLRDGQPTNEDGRLSVQVPAPGFDVQSLDVEWKSIPAQLMYEILSFSDLVALASHRVSGAFENDYEEGFEERQFQYASLGLRAAKIANDLRNSYGLPEREHEDWNPVEYLLGKREEIKKVRARREEQQSKFWNPDQKS